MWAIGPDGVLVRFPLNQSMEKWIYLSIVRNPLINLLGTVYRSHVCLVVVFIGFTILNCDTLSQTTGDSDRIRNMGVGIGQHHYTNG